MDVKKIAVAALLASGLVLAPPVYAQENGEIENAYQTTIADKAYAVDGSMAVMPGSTSKLTMIIKELDSEKRIEPKESSISFEADIKGYSVDIHGREVTVKVDKSVKPTDLDKTAKITYTFDDGSTEETTLDISVVDDKDFVKFSRVENGDMTLNNNSKTPSGQDSNTRPTPHTPANSTEKAKPQPESPVGESELLKKTLWTMMNAGETKTVQLLNDPDSSSEVKIAIDRGSVPANWKVDVGSKGILSITPDLNERLRKVIINVEATRLDGQKDTTQVEVNVIPVTSEGHKKTEQRFEEMQRTGELDEYLEKNPELREAMKEAAAATPESSTDSSRTVLASTGASVSALGLLGLLTLAAGTFPLLRKRR
ncbi:hypothetical protein FRC0184_02253 [Corynebacterium diphtheriae]|nr:hypothetical protein FRC0184_02253 [Corynebacterium diphtheriae]